MTREHPAVKKVRTLDDFFKVNAFKRHRTDKVVNHHGLHTVPGLTILPDFVTPAEEANLLAFLEEENWRTDLARRTIHYGGTYCLKAPRGVSEDERKRVESTILTAKQLPVELKWLVDRMVRQKLYCDTSRPAFCIVNEYTGSQGISAHVENFRFGEPVCGLTLGNGDHMRFHELSAAHDGSVRSGRASQAPRTGRRVDVWLPRRCLVVLRGDARSKWQHEIVRRSRGVDAGWRRVSLTFRVEKHHIP